MTLALYLAVSLTCILAEPWLEIEPDVDVQILWEKFQTDFNKTYLTNWEKEERGKIFAINLKYIYEHNEKYKKGESSFLLGINQFADLTQQEYLKFYTGSIRVDNETHGITFLAPSNVELPSAIDWRTKGYVTPVKDQGQCGSCWSFSATGAIESQHARKTGKLISLSEQQLVDCDSQSSGCNGGYKDKAFLYVRKVGGIEGESDYPYVTKQQNCNFVKSKIRATVSGYVQVPRSETSLQSAVASEGPVSVSIDASARSFRFYKGGVYNEPACSSVNLGHAVLVVGYGTSPSDYWLVKNSWGTSWGIGGYIQMSRNKGNQCGIATRAVYPTV